MDLQIVEFIQSFRTGFFDLFFSLITELGDETIFIVIVGLFYWTVSKTYGYRYAMLFLTSVVFNESLKGLFQRPRPFTLDSVESVVPETSGYSIPSGHAQNSTMHALLLNERFGSLYKFVRPVLTTLVVLISFSRIYLGQHYLSDVIAGVAVAAAIYFGLQYVSRKVTWPTPTVVLASMPLLLINVWITVAGMLGGTIGYQLEQRYIQFDVKASLPIQGFKFVLGIAVTLGLQEGLKLVFPYTNATEFMTLVWDFLRYALLVLWVTLGAPATFKLLFQRKAA